MMTTDYLMDVGWGITNRKVRGMFLNRVVQRREAHRIFAALPTTQMSMAEISGVHWARAFTWKEAASFSFPDYDICQGVFCHEDGLFCTNPVRDSSRESSVIAVVDEQTEHPELQDPELARV
jgi:hypothetical protein